MKEQNRLRIAMQAPGRKVTGGGEGEATTLVVAIAHLLEDFSRLEQSHVARAAIQVVAHHVQQAGRQ